MCGLCVVVFENLVLFVVGCDGGEVVWVDWVV